MRSAYRNTDLEWHQAFQLMRGAKPPNWFVSDGASKAPDELFGVNITPAAHWHDFHYSGHAWLRNDETARYMADRLFYQNLVLCGLSKPVAFLYYAEVRLWGHYHFRYDPGHEPQRTLGFWVRMLLGRCVRW